eukprot:12339515-Prorocentrum_lima.AAC.1
MPQQPQHMVLATSRGNPHKQYRSVSHFQQPEKMCQPHHSATCWLTPPFHAYPALSRLALQ